MSFAPSKRDVGMFSLNVVLDVGSGDKGMVVGVSDEGLIVVGRPCVVQ